MNPVQEQWQWLWGGGEKGGWMDLELKHSGAPGEGRSSGVAIVRFCHTHSLSFLCAGKSTFPLGRTLQFLYP